MDGARSGLPGEGGSLQDAATPTERRGQDPNGLVAETRWFQLSGAYGWSGGTLMRIDPSHGTGFIHCDDNAVLADGLRDFAWGGTILPVRIVPVQDRLHARLMHCRFDGVFDAADNRRLCFKAADTPAAEFELQPLDAAAISPELAAVAVSICRLYEIARSGGWLLPGNQAELAEAGATAFRATLASMTNAELERLADACIGSPPFAALCGRQLGDDHWAAALSRLSEWNQDRDEWPHHRRTGPEHDELAVVAGIDGRPKGDAARLNLLCRKRILPRKRCGLIATACNEGPYLLDWIAYHQSIGIEQVTIYSNNNSDGSDALLGALADGGVILWVDNPTPAGASAQFKSYGHALGVLPETLDCEWNLILDLDEYFCFDASRFDSIGDYINWQSAAPVDAILLNWLVYGPAQESDPAGIPGFPGLYHWRTDPVDVHVKTMSRSRLFNHAHAHVPVCDVETGPVVRRSDGSLFKHQLGGGLEPFVHEHPSGHAWINHYLLRSPREMLVKWLRNRGDEAVSSEIRLHLPEGVVDMLIRALAPDALVRDDRIMACAATMASQRNRLLRFPGVAEAQREVERLHPIREQAAIRLLISPEAAHPTGGAAARLIEAVAGVL